MNQDEILEVLESFDSDCELSLLLNGSNNISDRTVEDFFNKLGYTTYEKIGSGAFRIAYRAGDIVIKIGSSFSGRCCNDFETLFINEFSHEKQRRYLPAWYWSSTNNWVVIWEYVDGIDVYNWNSEHGNKLVTTSDYQAHFPDWMTWDWHGGNVLVRRNGVPCVVDFTANAYEYDVKATMKDFNETGKWSPQEIKSGQLKYPPSLFSFVRLSRRYKSCDFAYVIAKDRGYDVFPIFDADPNGGHDFHWLTKIKGFIEEQVCTCLDPRDIEGEVNAPGVFDHLLETLNLE